MKRSEKQLPSKKCFSTFLKLNCSVKSLRVTESVKEIKFEGGLGKLEAENVSRDNFYPLLARFKNFEKISACFHQTNKI